MTAIRLLVVGHGRMGRMIESLSSEYGMTVSGIVSRSSAGRPDEWPDADVAVDFSTAEALAQNLPRLAARGMCLVIGTTGWQDREEVIRRELTGHPIGVVAAPNFALGVNLFVAMVERGASLLAERPEFGAWIHELHHAQKRDAPSGTAIAIREAMKRAGYAAVIDVASTRAGAIPGIHTVGFDSKAETITLTHATRDRTAFARGALEAARWVHGRRGWFTMRDVLGL